MITGLVICLVLAFMVGGILALAACIVQARSNARHRAIRRAMSAEALELALMRREFDAIVAANHARKD